MIFGFYGQKYIKKSILQLLLALYAKRKRPKLIMLRMWYYLYVCPCVCVCMSMWVRGAWAGVSHFDKFMFTCNILTYTFHFRFFGCDNHKNTFLQILIDLARKFPEFEAAHCCNGHSIADAILHTVGGSLFNGFGSICAGTQTLMFMPSCPPNARPPATVRGY